MNTYQLVLQPVGRVRVWPCFCDTYTLLLSIRETNDVVFTTCPPQSKSYRTPHGILHRPIARQAESLLRSFFLGGAEKNSPVVRPFCEAKCRSLLFADVSSRLIEFKPTYKALNQGAAVGKTADEPACPNRQKRKAGTTGKRKNKCLLWENNDIVTVRAAIQAG